jgi:hypothetical protein
LASPTKSVLTISSKTPSAHADQQGCNAMDIEEEAASSFLVAEIDWDALSIQR